MIKSICILKTNKQANNPGTAILKSALLVVVACERENEPVQKQQNSKIPPEQQQINNNNNNKNQNKKAKLPGKVSYRGSFLTMSCDLIPHISLS